MKTIQLEGRERAALVRIVKKFNAVYDAVREGAEVDAMDEALRDITDDLLFKLEE